MKMSSKNAITRQEIETIVQTAKEEIILALKSEIKDLFTTVIQARQVEQETVAESLSGLDRKVNRILVMSRKLLKNERAILWYTSSNDPKYKPTDKREMSAVRRVMVQYAQTLLTKDFTLSERSAANIVIAKFCGVEGAYGPGEQETFRRQINRTDQQV